MSFIVNPVGFRISHSKFSDVVWSISYNLLYKNNIINGIYFFKFLDWILSIIKFPMEASTFVFLYQKLIKMKNQNHLYLMYSNYAYKQRSKKKQPKKKWKKRKWKTFFFKRRRHLNLRRLNYRFKLYLTEYWRENLYRKKNLRFIRYRLSKKRHKGLYLMRLFKKKTNVFYTKRLTNLQLNYISQYRFLPGQQRYIKKNYFYKNFNKVKKRIANFFFNYNYILNESKVYIKKHFKKKSNSKITSFIRFIKRKKFIKSKQSKIFLKDILFNIKITVNSFIKPINLPLSFKELMINNNKLWYIKRNIILMKHLKKKYRIIRLKKQITTSFFLSNIQKYYKLNKKKINLFFLRKRTKSIKCKFEYLLEKLLYNLFKQKNSKVSLLNLGKKREKFSANTLARFTKYKLEHNWPLFVIVKDIKRLLKRSLKIIGYKVSYKGRYSRRLRNRPKKIMSVIKGIKTSTISAPLTYSILVMLSKNGMYSFKIWTIRRQTKHAIQF